MQVDITNVHLDLGAGRRGTDMGPSAIHVAGLVERLRGLGHQVRIAHSIQTSGHEANDFGDPKARYLPMIESVCRRLRDGVRESVEAGSFPLVLGGDHAQAMGTIAGITQALKTRGRKLGVLWVDAHTDMNTPDSTPSGNIHGMPLANLLGHGHRSLLALNGDAPALEPQDVVIFGARDVDSTEVPLVKELGVRVFTMTEIDRRGVATCLDEAIERISVRTDGVHLSFDLDGIDPTHAPGVGTPVPGGLTLRESHLICEAMALTGALVGMEMVELNPTLDHANTTGELAVWLIQSALGKTIL